jgi:hypothetical protein
MAPQAILVHFTCIKSTLDSYFLQSEGAGHSLATTIIAQNATRIFQDLREEQRGI